jgi:hypothetical protein
MSVKNNTLLKNVKMLSFFSLELLQLHHSLLLQEEAIDFNSSRLVLE